MNPITLVGLIATSYALFRFIFFVYTYVRPSSIGRYLKSGSYALVTGASDGIGKAVALELAREGFNVILHGRNVNKLKDVVEEIKQKYPARKTVTFVHDASKRDIPLDISSFKSLPISVLVNNVGHGPIDSFENFTAKQIDELVQLNSVFPTLITQAVLPLLTKPSLILNVSSFAGMLAIQ